jgi:fumarate reductase flavoprotein subunit
MSSNQDKGGSALPRLSKRRFLQGLGATGLSSIGLGIVPADAAENAGKPYDVIIVGAGTAGIPTAIFAAGRGARVLLIEAASAVGGTLFMSSAQMAGAGTKLQKSLGIEDSPQAFYDDVMRIGGGLADPEILRLFVENSAVTLDWLSDNGFEPLPDHPVLGGGHEPYMTRRYLWAKDGGLSVLAVLEPLLHKEIASGKVTLLLDTSVTDLIQNATDGAIKGVVATGSDGKAVKYLGHNVVLTSGGYGSNSEIFKAVEGIERYADMVYPYSLGAGVKLAIAAGGTTCGTECRQPLFNAVMVDNAVPSTMLFRITSNPNQRAAWEIYVNSRGERFFQEDTPSYDAKEKALKKQPKERCWIVFDDAILDAAPSISRAWNKEELKAAFGKYPTFYKADSLEGLAAATGVDKAGLLASVADYNKGQKSGQDSFGRTHMPLPIGKAPFYAIQLQGYYYVDSGGVKIDKSLRVVGKGGKAIPNLYAAGEILGYGQLQGAGYSGGMAVTPAITFGRLLGQSILKIST